MVPQRNFVAPQRLGLVVQMPPPHFGAQIARGFFGLVRHCENVGFKHRDRNIHQRRVAFDLLTVLRIVSGVHHQKHQRKGEFAEPLQQLQQLGHQHRILAARNAHRDLVAGRNQLVSFDGTDKRIPQHLAVFFHNTAFNLLNRGERFGHISRSLYIIYIGLYINKIRLWVYHTSRRLSTPRHCFPVILSLWQNAIAILNQYMYNTYRKFF